MATDFRSGHEYPRRAREVYGGYTWLLRVFDKGRAAKHGTIDEYIYPCPIDQAVMRVWGITPAAFDDALDTCTTDEQILAWMNANVTPEARDRANRYVLVDRRHNLDKHDIEEGILPDLATLAGRIAALRTKGDRLSRHQKEIQDEHFEELLASGQRERAAKAGDRAPAFELRAADGTTFTSAGALAAGPLIVAFIRGTWSPECVVELEALDEIVPELTAAGGTLVAISPERPERVAAFFAKKKLGFPILFDRGNAVAERYGIAYAVSPEMQTLYRDGMEADLAAVNDDPAIRLPMPSRFFIDPTGIIREAKVHPVHVQRAEPRESLALVSG
jgi:peroxiredoxin